MKALMILEAVESVLYFGALLSMVSVGPAVSMAEVTFLGFSLLSAMAALVALTS